MKRWNWFIGGSPYLVHSPPGPRNGGIPLSTDMPAPVSAIGYRAQDVSAAVAIFLVARPSSLCHGEFPYVT